MRYFNANLNRTIEIIYNPTPFVSSNEKSFASIDEIAIVFTIEIMLWTNNKWLDFVFHSQTTALSPLLLISLTHKSGLFAISAHVIFTINISDLKFLNLSNINITVSKIESGLRSNIPVYTANRKTCQLFPIVFSNFKERADYLSIKSHHVIFILSLFNVFY